ncbi:signal recognition particle receptor subunit alpha, partial [Candidatus Aenigmatarchaeota archaeon]
MLKGLSSKLRGAIENFSKGSADKEAVEELVKDMQRTLLSSDVDVDLVFSLSENIKKRSFEKIPAGLSRREHVVKVVYEELTNILGEEQAYVNLVPKKILLVGLFGSGKTTTAAKLARFYQNKGLKVSLICCDTVRPAAYEQLEQLSKQIDVPFYGIKGEKDSSVVLKNKLKEIKTDIVIVDSSGRSALDEELMDEIKSLNNILGDYKKDVEYEKILVIPADIGQAAKEQARAFNQIGITNVIVSKLDATAKGGGAITACHETGSKILFLTVGEKPTDIEHYDPKKFVARLLGFPDLETLLEKAKESINVDATQKIVSGDFDIEDFYSQIEGMQNMGSFSKIFDMMGAGKLAKKVPGGLDVQEEKMKRWKYAISSMTPSERSDPTIVTSSRIKRIAQGSGLRDHDVREMI